MVLTPIFINWRVYFYYSKFINNNLLTKLKRKNILFCLIKPSIILYILTIHICIVQTISAQASNKRVKSDSNLQTDGVALAEELIAATT
jgi:hypothetical protein